MTRDITTIPEDQWVEVPPGFALSPAVKAAADRWLVVAGADTNDLALEVHLRCGVCDQSILPLVTVVGAYRVRIADMTAQLVSHLMQRHGWTREVPGE